MVAPAFECRTIRMQKGDTLYIPKGMVHYARSPEESPVVSVHMTISQDRHSGSWLDYVASEPPFHLPASTDRICLFPSAMQYARTPKLFMSDMLTCVVDNAIITLITSRPTR